MKLQSNVEVTSDSEFNIVLNNHQKFKQKMVRLIDSQPSMLLLTLLTHSDAQHCIFVFSAMEVLHISRTFYCLSQTVREIRRRATHTPRTTPKAKPKAKPEAT